MKLGLTLARVGALAMVGSLLAAPTLAQSSYTVTDLGTLGGSASYALSLNNRGQVSGLSNGATYPTGYPQPFVWTPTVPNGVTGTMRKLALPRGYDWGHARAINDSGQVVGVGGKNWNAILWSVDGTPNILGYLTKNPTASWAEAINNAGQIAGASEDSAGHWAPFLWKPAVPNGIKGKMVQIGPVDWGVGNENGNAHSINAYGQVTYPVPGYVNLWTPTSANGTTGSSVTLPVAHQQSGLNDFGQATAWDGVGTSLLWTPNTPNSSTGSAVAIAGGSAGPINFYGQVAGFDENNHLYLWTPIVPNGTTGTKLDLSTATFYNESGNLDSSWSFSSVTGLNNSGQMIGTGAHNGAVRAYLLTPR